MPRWNITRLKPGSWYTTDQAAKLIGVSRKQVINRAAPNAPRPLPLGLIVQRATQRGQTVLLIGRDPLYEHHDTRPY